jgi:HAD superfamily hydrolase (TIGR01509 family)
MIGSSTPLPELVIFDCDGVLIDSEPLSANVLMGMMAAIGLIITPEIFRSDFLGRSFAAAAAKTEARFGQKLPEDFQPRYRTELLSRMKGNLRIMDGAVDVLQSLRVRYCLATSSSPERLAFSLSETGLAPFFRDRSFTASLVSRGKPAPDLFLLAARELNTSPQSAIVIEDSEMGLRAALSAGMQTWHFTGGGHMDGIVLPHDVVPHQSIGSMADLKSAFAALGICA